VSKLTPGDLAFFAEFRISAGLLDVHHIERVTNQEAREHFGIGTKDDTGDMSGIVFPYRFVPGTNGDRVTAAVRRDHPEIENGKAKRKYMHAWGDAPHLYFPCNSRELADPETTIVFVEAQKSCLALTAWGGRNKQKIVCIAVGGTQGWKCSKNGAGGVQPDLACVAGHKVVVLFDANVAFKPDLEAHRYAFKEVLLRRFQAASVFTPNLPTHGRKDINGPDDFLNAFPDEALTEVLTPPSVDEVPELVLPDMPESVLCGKIGEICRKRMGDFPIAYSWLSLLAAASALVKPKENDPIRTNLFVGLVGPVNSGKSTAQERAISIMGIENSLLLARLKAGSGEGLMAKLGDRGGDNALLCPDELAHLFEKASIQNSSFSSILTSLFYQDKNDFTIARGKVISSNVRLSLAGGLVDIRFEESFGEVSTAGLYDRFLFGQYPSTFVFHYRPYGGGAVFDPIVSRPTAQYVNHEVFEEKKRFVEQEGVNPRLAEIGLRCAMICAAFDEVELTAGYLTPFWELVRYQTRVRMWLQPNTGKNFDAQLAEKILRYLKARAPKGQRVKLRDVRREIHADRFGPVIMERTIRALAFSGQIVVEDAALPSGRLTKIIALSTSED
jgi:hypothetical protein